MLEKYKDKIIYLIVVITALGIFGGWLSYSKNNTSEIEILKTEEKTIEIDEASEEFFYVHVSGEVNKPGVFELKPGTRLEDVISLAGGLTSEGDSNAINLARKIKDEEKIHVPKIEEANQASKETQGSKGKETLININSGSLEELKSLPGIGDVLGKNIIDYREKNGDFIQLEDLKNVNRIGDKLFEGIQDLILL